MSKTIRLSEEAYEHLVTQKQNDETFSDVILRLTAECSLLGLAGILDEKEADALREAVDERRTRRSEELERFVGER